MSDLDQLLQQMADPSGLAWNEETYDLALARGLSDADRATYVAKLIDAAKQGDTHAILTLGNLHAMEALPVLQAAGKSKEPWALTARRGLTLLGHGADVVDAIAHDAVHASAKMARVAAVMDLGKIGGVKAIAALEQALADKDSAVRMLAWDGLVEALDLDRWIRSPSGTHEKTTHLELVKDFLASDLHAFVQMGVDEMRAITKPLAAGADPASLGLTWIGDPAPEASSQIMQAIVDADAAYPVDAIARLTGVPRRWAEASVAMRLDQADPDPRVPDALVRLKAGWTRPVLEEVARSPSTSPEVRAKLTQAANALQRS
jgi:HEAT repeat protein